MKTLGDVHHDEVRLGSEVSQAPMNDMCSASKVTGSSSWTLVGSIVCC